MAPAGRRGCGRHGGGCRSSGRRRRDATMTLEVRGVTKRFAGIVALEGIDRAVPTGESVGLIGPNGAVKTTLFNCILGITRPEEGSITYDGVNISKFKIHRRARLGIGRTFQRLELFGGMTAREHVLVAARAH